MIQAAGTPGALVPMGDELGDVGQYYSQVDPSQLSRLGIYNPNGSSVSVSVSCTQMAERVRSLPPPAPLPANTGVEVRTDTITQTVCSNLSARPRGVYHGVITSSGGNVAVANWVNNDTTTGNPLVSSAYEAVQAGMTSTTHYLYGVLVRGTSGNDWTDTEFVVQNPSTTTDAYVQFTLCESNGTTCWNNNSAVVPKNGHRIFLLSQLAYQNSGGSLTEKSGGLSTNFTVTNSVPVATMANMFRQNSTHDQNSTDGRNRSKVDGLLWSATGGQQRCDSPFLYRESGDSSGGYSHAVKVQNLGASSTTVTVELRDANGNVPTNGTASKSVGADPVVGFDGYEFNVAAGTYAARIYSSGSNNLAAWHWRSGCAGYSGDVWQPVDTSNNNVYFPVARKDFDSWHTAFGYYTSGSSSRSSRAIEQFLTNYYSNGQSNTVGAFFGGLYHHAWSTTTSGDNAPSGNTNGLFRGWAALDDGNYLIRLMPVVLTKSGSGDTRVAYNATGRRLPPGTSPSLPHRWCSSLGIRHPGSTSTVTRVHGPVAFHRKCGT